MPLNTRNFVQDRLANGLDAQHYPFWSAVEQPLAVLDEKRRMKGVLPFGAHAGDAIDAFLDGQFKHGRQVGRVVLPVTIERGHPFAAGGVKAAADCGTLPTIDAMKYGADLIVLELYQC